MFFSLPPQKTGFARGKIPFAHFESESKCAIFSSVKPNLVVGRLKIQQLPRSTQINSWMYTCSIHMVRVVQLNFKPASGVLLECGVLCSDIGNADCTIYLHSIVQVV